MIKWATIFHNNFLHIYSSVPYLLWCFPMEGYGSQSAGPHTCIYRGLFRQQFFTQNSFSFHYIDVSNHRHLNRLLNCLFRCRQTKTSKLSVIGLCEGEYTCDRFPRHCCQHMCLFDCSSSRFSREAGVHDNSRSVLEIFWNLQANMRFRYLENRGE